MSKEKLDSRKQIADSRQKLPKVVMGVFIFNDKGELFLMKYVQWNNLYSPPGGGIELGESIVEAAKRKVKEETNMNINDIEFLSITERLNLGGRYTKTENNLIFINYKEIEEYTKNVKLNEEGVSYKWLKVEEWLKKKNINPTAREVIEKHLNQENNYEEKYKRALADYQNLLKRTAIEKQEFAKYANEGLLHEILPVYDNLKMSLAHADTDAEKNGWLEGVQYVVKQFKEVLEKMGVEEIKTIGEKFDHHTMEAIDPSAGSGQAPSAGSGQEEKGNGDIVEKEVKPGYKLNGKMIIPAKVILK